MATSTPNQQCAVVCESCDNPKVKWKCIHCDIKLCTDCKGKIHSRCKLQKDHKIVDIKEMRLEVSRKKPSRNHQPQITVELTNEEKYGTKLNCIKLLSVSTNNLLWIGSGEKQNTLRQRLFAKPTALQKVELQEKNLNVTVNFDITVSDIAVTSTNDLLLASGDSKLKQITYSDQQCDVKDSVYGLETLRIQCVHVTKDDNVIVGGAHRCSEVIKSVHIMDKDGNELRTYQFDKNDAFIFKNPMRITSTSNGNIFVLDKCGTSMENGESRVMVIRQNDIIIAFAGKYISDTLVTTSSDNVIVVETISKSLHFLNHNGDCLATFKTTVKYPISLAFSTEGKLNWLYIGCKTPEGKSNKAKLYKMNILEY